MESATGSGRVETEELQYRTKQIIKDRGVI